MDLAINNALLNTPDALVIIILFGLLNGLESFLRKNIFKSIIFILMYVVVMTFLDFVIPAGIKAAVGLILVSLLMGFITKKNIIVSFIANTIIILYIYVIELIVMLVSVSVLHIDLNTLVSTVSVKMICGFIAKIAELVLALLLMKFNLRIKKLDEFKKPNALLQLMTFQSLMIVIILISLSNVTAYKEHTLLYNVFIMVIACLFLMLYVIDYKERERLNAIQNRSMLQEEYIKNMESIINIIRREKHDFSNHLNTILAMCTLNKEDTIQKIGNYIRKLSVKLIDSYHFYNTGNDFVDGMLAVKSNVAFELGIQLDADFQAPLNKLDINDCDITSIIGNITDNALEAIQELGECEGRRVSIETYLENMEFCISISNNGPMIGEKDMGRIFSSGYSTKETNKSDHGFGLYIVNQLVQRYNGRIYVNSNEDKTEFLIRFKRDAKDNG